MTATFAADLSLREAQSRLAEVGQWLPVDGAGDATLGSFLDRPPVTIREGATLREAADVMVKESVGRLPLLGDDGSLIGLVTRSDLLAAHAPRLREHEKRERTIRLRSRRRPSTEARTKP